MEQVRTDGAGGQTPATEHEIWLLGQPPLRRFLEFVEEFGESGAMPDRATLIREWSEANDTYLALRSSEAGIADMVESWALDTSLAPLAEEVMADARYRHSFDSLPTCIAMVELDRLVVCQNHVTRDFVEHLKSRLGPRPDSQAVFHFCLPLEPATAPVQIRQAGDNRYLFSSASTDFRFHEPVVLRPDQLCAYQSFGNVAGVLGLVVGFTANFLNVIHDDDSHRLLLHNGYHRACALRELGITHAPCIIQTVTRRDELDIVAKAAVASDPGYFFNLSRPPLLKDFRDPRIRKVVPIKKGAKMVEVSFEVRDYFMPE